MQSLLKFLWTNSYRKDLKVSSCDLLVMYLQECMFLIIPSADRKFVELQYRFHRDTRLGGGGTWRIFMMALLTLPVESFSATTTFLLD